MPQLIFSELLADVKKLGIRIKHNFGYFYPFQEKIRIIGIKKGKKRATRYL